MNEVKHDTIYTQIDFGIYHFIKNREMLNERFLKRLSIECYDKSIVDYITFLGIIGLKDVA